MSHTTFSVFHSGKFQTDDSGAVTYEGGNRDVLHSPVEALFGNLMSELNISSNGQRIWFKMPNEGISELKILCQGDDNFRKMCEASVWIKAIDVYLEADNVDDDDDDAPPVVEINDSGTATRASNGAAKATQKAVDAEARVESNLIGFVDDNENDDYQRTPPSSDCEDEGSNDRYERWIRGSGELKIRQVFESIEEFKEAVLEYALKGENKINKKVCIFDRNKV
ncbi:PREDICTED: uncharacterized protein LOC106340476 [Brassica oleracea var. oleracea]|uniref:uncharacterized protein LOC106340476 n=1 Tax=Brassica oleracea var. oleracea TaxID=109376 RepID=UPI0006A7059A|nr:PREDICTED: uncharacterized protein LOC106340476 [Brassica oleracea var. oleracea]